MCEKSGGMAGLAEVRVQCAERESTNREPRQFQCSQLKKKTQNNLYKWLQVFCVNQKYLELQIFILLCINRF